MPNYEYDPDYSPSGTDDHSQDMDFDNDSYQATDQDMPDYVHPVTSKPNMW